jgi:hypothetical protein
MAKKLCATSGLHTNWFFVRVQRGYDQPIPDKFADIPSHTTGLELARKPHDAVLENSRTKADVQDNIRRAVRGGSYSSQAWSVRSDYNQLRNEPTRRHDNLGFRVARTFP